VPRRSKLDREIDALFQQPPGEFVQARNALANRIKAAGNADRAAAIRALVKPNVPAWVVNRLAVESRSAFRRLARLGDKLGEVQRGAPKAAQSLRKTLDDRRAALATLRDDAERLLTDAGHAANKTTMRRIEATLEALATPGGLPSTCEAGRLSRDLEPGGFDALLELPAVSPDVPRKKTAGSARRRKLLIAAVRRAAKELGRRRGVQDRALETRNAAAVKLEELRAETARAARRLSSARKRQEKAEASLQSAKRDVVRTSKALTRTEDSLRAAREQLDD
jgi:hypothetical protein